MIRPECRLCKHNLASGMWLLHLKGGEAKAMALCADCGLTKALKKIRMFESKTGEMVFYRYVERVELIQSFSRDSTPDEASPAPLTRAAQALIRKHNTRKAGPTLAQGVTERKDWSYRGPTWLDRQLEIPED